MPLIPTKTTVLVVGGGPGGSYSASALAREGIDTVILEADIFPRYHVGESMVASIRHFLKFIDLDETFNNHGFVKKVGSFMLSMTFKLHAQKESYTDFIVATGPDVYAWNVVRSESDDLMFRHAEKCGAKIFEGVKVTSLEFVNDTEKAVGKPVTATWKAKDGSEGVISFDYLVDASGRAMSTKYLKNRTFNHDLKNVASWGYWKGAIQYGIGTPKMRQPFFEALADGSGWCWFIPLHNGTVSVGVVMNQEMSTEEKKKVEAALGAEFYVESVKEARGISKLLANANLSTDVKHASDWSYSADKYSSPNVRIVGDAASFIDPYFSSGIHLAVSGALSAAVAICASIRENCTEEVAGNWHSQGVSERYTRFLLVVLSATKQIRAKDAPIMNDVGEDGFDDAFSIIRPVIQGIADIGKSDQSAVNKSNDFTYGAIEKNSTNGKVSKD